MTPVAERDGLTALERLRLHVHDHETFPFFHEDAEEILEEYEVALTELQHLRAAEVQCCMCGKTGLSTTEGDGGQECELDDGRWVCSGECWDRAVASPSSPATGVRVKALDDVAVDGTLKRAGPMYPGPIVGNHINGDLYGDRKGRFADGTNVTTSKVKEVRGGVIVTNNSTYRVEWHDKSALGEQS